ncbi:MAG: signal peptide peptidase SppA [Flavobacteriaceae bacterium]|nr:signal peptide peptidase SppA [Flavobacteriaceae bacterium]
MKFLRNLLAAVLGSLIAFGIVFFMFLIFASLASTEEGVSVKDNSVLELKIPYPIQDYTGKSDDDPFNLFYDPVIGLDDIIHAITIAAEDDDIKGISLNNNFLMAGISQTQAIRKALEDFKSTGKFVYAYGDFYMQKDYYLASVADSIYMNPLGGLDFKGLAAEVLFFKDLQDKSGIKMEVVRHGKYKSAVEPFLDDEMSPENREQIAALLESVWGSMLTDIAEGRDLSTETLNTIADTLGARLPEYAHASGLVDGVIYSDEYESRLKLATGTDADDKQPQINVRDYMKRSSKRKTYSGKDKIAVIYAQGDIMYGEGGPNIIGQGLITKALRKARDNSQVKAVVLRVNSPGGSAITSDIIWREVELTKEKIPVVVSMGNVAASGGYYIAVGADKIFAEPTTITGSIGVFGTIPNISEFAEKIGINAEQVGTNLNSVDYSLFEPMSPQFRGYVKEGIEEVYTTFLRRVSDGRNISMAQADSLAQGRVWSGVEAKELGLIDELGGLDDAILAAAELAEIEDFGIRKYPRFKSGFQRFMDEMASAKSESIESQLKNEMSQELYSVFTELKTVVQQRGIQARLPYTIRIR